MAPCVVAALVPPSPPTGRGGGDITIFLRLRTWEIGVVFFVLSLSLASPVCALSLIGPLKRNLSSVEAFLLFLKGDLGKYYRCGVQIYFPTRLFPHFPWRSDLYTPSLVSLLQPQWRVRLLPLSSLATWLNSTSPRKAWDSPIIRVEKCVCDFVKHKHLLNVVPGPPSFFLHFSHLPFLLAPRGEKRGGGGGKIMEGEKRRKSPESIKLEGKREKGPEEKGPLTSFASFLPGDTSRLERKVGKKDTFYCYLENEPKK